VTTACFGPERPSKPGRSVVLSPEGKPPEQEADQLPFSGAKVKNARRFTYTPPYSLHGVMVEHRDSFTSSFALQPSVDDKMMMMMMMMIQLYRPINKPHQRAEHSIIPEFTLHLSNSVVCRFTGSLIL